jgi:hypothetical protein
MDSTFPGPDEPEKLRATAHRRAEASILAANPARPDCLPAPPAARPWKTPGARASPRAAHGTFADLQSQRLTAQPLARS